MNSDTTISQAVGRFLKRVGEHLANKGQEEKREILADLESHIYEALHSCSQGRQPTLEDLQAVLAEMDPPESYGQATERITDHKALGPANKTTLGIVALCISLGSLVAAGFLFLAIGHMLGYWIPYLLFYAGQSSGLILGVLAWINPFGKAAVITSALLIVLSMGFTA